MNKTPYTGRCRTRKDRCISILLLVLFLLVTVSAAAAGQLRDLPDPDKPAEEAESPMDPVISPSSASASAAGQDMQRAYRLLYIAPDPAPPSPSSAAPIYDIPLSVELQIYTYETCLQYDIDYETALAVMYVESRYQPDAISMTHDYGIMQINKYNHKWLSEALGFTYTTTEELRQNFLDPYKCILAGVYMLRESAGKYSDPHRMLMVYNLGPKGAKDLWAQGIYSTKYSRAVVAKANEIRG